MQHRKTKNHFEAIGVLADLVRQNGRVVAGILELPGDVPVLIPIVLDAVPAEITAELTLNDLIEIAGKLVYFKKAQGHAVDVEWLYRLEPGDPSTPRHIHTQRVMTQIDQQRKHRRFRPKRR